MPNNRDLIPPSLRALAWVDNSVRPLEHELPESGFCSLLILYKRPKMYDASSLDFRKCDFEFAAEVSEMTAFWLRVE